MSLPDEQARALNAAREFLEDMIRLERGTWKISRLLLAVRERARACLRHYPSRAEIEAMCAAQELVRRTP